MVSRHEFSRLISIPLFRVTLIEAAEFVCESWRADVRGQSTKTAELRTFRMFSPADVTSSPPRVSSVSGSTSESVFSGTERWCRPCRRRVRTSRNVLLHQAGGKHVRACRVQPGKRFDFFVFIMTLVITLLANSVLI